MMRKGAKSAQCARWMGEILGKRYMDSRSDGLAKQLSPVPSVQVFGVPAHLSTRACNDSKGRGNTM